MSRFRVFFILIAFIGVSSCKNVNIYEEYHDSVVMIYHEWLYKANVDGDDIYFCYDEATGKFYNLQDKLENAEKDAMVAYGTGFFFSKDGKIGTNRHVVYELTDDIKLKAKGYFRDIADNEKFYYDSLKNNAGYQITAWTNKYYQAYYQEDQDDANREIGLWKDLQSQYSKSLARWERIQSSLSNVDFSVETLFLGYAPDGTSAKKLKDYKECELVTYSKEKDIDLAIIQTDDKKLPESVMNIIQLSDVPDSPLKVGEEVSMLGYNLGPDISLTTAGLKVQNTSGKVSQEDNGNRVLYSINAMPGSSGSPVLSKDGELVAINYYGYSSQAFNYGILAKHLVALAK